MSYGFIYKLKPHNEVEPGWWKLKWKPIFKHTWNVFVYRGKLFGFRTYRIDANNGWHRSYKHLFVELDVLFKKITFWVKWDIVVHEDGPSDMKPRKSLFIKTMSFERYYFLMSSLNAQLTKEEIKQGWHFCIEWDGLLIHPDMPEFDACSCEINNG